MTIMKWLSAVAAALMFCAVGTVAAAEIPALGSIAPEFSLPDQNGHLSRLGDWHGRWLVLYFYPKDDTPGCTEEACHFRDDLQALKALGAQVVGISVDDAKSHAAFAQKYHLPFPLLADSDASVAKKYGAYSDWLVTGFAKRYTFLIDPNGRIVHSYLSVDTSRHSVEIIADLKRLSGVGK
jgi:peroxiredoxin Q/BCP